MKKKNLFLARRLTGRYASLWVSVIAILLMMMTASILLLSSDIDVVGIDEAQFFDMGLVDVCNELANRGIRVIVAGLDMDFRGVPFGPMPALCAIADDVTKVHAICVKCGSLAYVSHRLVKNDKRVLLGETQEYEPLCRECYQKALAAEEDLIYFLVS